VPIIVNIIWYLPATAIAFAIFYLLWWFVLHLCGVTSKKARWLSLPVFVFLLGLLLLIPSRPAEVFKSAFGFPPPHDVRELKAKMYLVGQSGVCYLRFEADEKTVQRILARGLTLADTNQPFSLTTGPNRQLAPEWWRPKDLGSNFQFYQVVFTNKDSYDWVRESLGYDPVSHLVLFKRDDID
jgi:hypothetical protein